MAVSLGLDLKLCSSKLFLDRQTAFLGKISTARGTTENAASGINRAIAVGSSHAAG